jgi:predicted RNA-binding protein
MLEHDKKKQQLKDLMDKRKQMVGKIKELWDRIG